MVNNEYYKEIKNEIRLKQGVRNSLTRGISNAVAALSLHTIWYDFVKNQENSNQYMDSLFNVTIVMFLIISIFYILSIFIRRISEMLYDKNINTTIENFTDMFLFAQLFMCTMQIIVYNQYTWSCVLIMALVIILLVNHFFVLYNNKGI